MRYGKRLKKRISLSLNPSPRGRDFNSQSLSKSIKYINFSTLESHIVANEIYFENNPEG